MYIPDKDLRALIDRAETYLLRQNYKEALMLYSQLIDKSAGNNSFLIFFLKQRASIYSDLKNWDAAIADLQRCVSLNPDDAGLYLSLGAFVTWKLFYSGNYRIDGDKQVLEESIMYYKECLKRSPDSITAWLNIMETYIFMQQWDDAISYYGTCQPYIDTKESQLIRTWLGCLALALAGDEIEQEDIAPLYNHTVQYHTNHDYNQIVAVLSELERIKYDPVKLNKAQRIHQLYLGLINRDEI